MVSLRMANGATLFHGESVNEETALVWQVRRTHGKNWIERCNVHEVTGYAGTLPERNLESWALNATLIGLGCIPNDQRSVGVASVAAYVRLFLETCKIRP